MEISKADWKLFQEKLGDWQERYMDKLNQKYIKILQDTEGYPSDRFWKLEKRINSDKRKPGVRLTIEKDEALYDIVRLMKDRVIKIEDLSDFSKELQEYVRDAVNSKF